MQTVHLLFLGNPAAVPDTVQIKKLHLPYIMQDSALIQKAVQLLPAVQKRFLRIKPPHAQKPPRLPLQHPVHDRLGYPCHHQGMRIRLRLPAGHHFFNKIPEAVLAGILHIGVQAAPDIENQSVIAHTAGNLLHILHQPSVHHKQNRLFLPAQLLIRAHIYRIHCRNIDIRVHSLLAVIGHGGGGIYLLQIL